MRILSRSILAGALVVGSLIGGSTALAAPPPAATASTAKLSQADEQFYRDRATNLGMNKAAINRMIVNLKKGILPLSQTSGSPVSETSKTENGFAVTTKTFADGSISKSSFEIPKRITPGAATPFSIGGCSDQSGVGVFPFTGCKVRTDQATLTIEFEADGRLGSNGNNPSFAAKITRIYGAWISTAGSASGPTMEVLTGTQVGSSPARARTSYLVTGGGIGTTTVSLTFYVRDGSRWDTSP
ncbi:hypothetical protein FHU41_000247 [Psychromicrobium silvestre]|uniref:Uncharacterized protein n=1 Tax=Psychromicrobium silvestre TaxID=1645614 RepID=A0A7Y9S5G7_9MICC|nr:hypothetical protein [Psychromicrobium silvestre]NYE94026.1 hypothetical protein [Psychromicrobium silvestre]